MPDSRSRPPLSWTNANVTLLRLLNSAASDLEHAAYAAESEDQHRQVRRILTPVLTALDER